MSKRQPKFKITFVASEVSEKLTSIVLNGDIVGNICHPGHTTHTPEQFHIELFQRVIGEPHLTTLKPLFASLCGAEQYVHNNLEKFHTETPLFLVNTPKRKKRLKSIKFGEDWI